MGIDAAMCPRQILLTRPREDSEELAKELIARGFSVLSEPLLSIRRIPGPPRNCKWTAIPQ